MKARRRKGNQQKRAKYASGKGKRRKKQKDPKFSTVEAKSREINGFSEKSLQEGENGRNRTEKPINKEKKADKPKKRGNPTK